MAINDKRIDTHEKQIRGNLEANSMARHLAEDHPARRRDPTAFSFTGGAAPDPTDARGPEDCE